MKPPTTNKHEFRESWLKQATNELRPYFESVGYPLPANIRFAIAFTSTGRKGKRIGEAWASESSEDQHYEIILRADLSNPVEVLGALIKQLVHTTIPNDAGHGKKFKAAAIKVGLQPPMRSATPGVLLSNRLDDLAATLGPLPHARLDIQSNPLVSVSPSVALAKPKKQRARMLKAECIQCGETEKPYVVRIAASTARDIGPPHCPKHGEMTVYFPDNDDEDAEPETQEAETV